MITTKKLAVVCSLLVAAGCTHHRGGTVNSGTSGPDSYGSSSSSSYPNSGANPSFNMPGKSAGTSSIYSNATDQATGTFQNQSGKDSLNPTADQPNTSRVYSTNKTESSIPTFTQSADSFAANIHGDTETDRTLAQQLMQDLRADTEVSPLISKVKINVSNGKATLTGTVQSEQEKQQLESAIARCSGVTSVDNQLQLSSSEPQPEQGK